ncbi:hypothetical protein VTL71DRAFT_13817 [Oculimacula yallundae]|uniref:Alpha/beta hydrolase fold-3 domain-containing protein n=1 Tax=Oculimacula yallundae TaxID=86028 RepID=A0ABR4CN27_9HELO
MAFSKAPPFDPALDAVLAAFPKADKPVDHAGLMEQRKGIEPFCTAAANLTDPDISYEEVSIPGPGEEIALTILRPKNGTDGTNPVFYTIHGGALVMGSRYWFLGETFALIKEFNAVVVSVEYRLAPEHPAPAAVEDCYSGLQWVSENASKLGIDPAKIIVTGGSAGGCLAAGITLLARDKKGPSIFALHLVDPMLDDRCTSVSINQLMFDGSYTGIQNISAWDMALPGKRGSKEVSIYVAPGRAEDLSGLPPTYISVGTGDPFRDEDVAFASKIWECGGRAELHVWPGAWHASTTLAPTADVSVAAARAGMDWMRRILK